MVELKTERDFEVPSDQKASGTCPYCERPFMSERARDLHVGEKHSEKCTEKELDLYEEADTDEKDELFLYHIKAVVIIGVLWAVFVLLYMIAIGSNII
jgi:hypothetical protein